MDTVLARLAWQGYAALTTGLVFYVTYLAGWALADALLPVAVDEDPTR